MLHQGSINFIFIEKQSLGMDETEGKIYYLA